VKLWKQIKSKLDGGLDADKHIQKEVGESPRVWQNPLLSLGPVHPRARTIVWNGGKLNIIPSKNVESPFSMPTALKQQ
jgi:hypothetical protein